MNNVFKKDLYRYYGNNGEPLLKKIFRPLEVKYISVFRKANMCKFLPLKVLYMLRLMYLSHKTQIQIPARTSIGEGLYIGHLGRVLPNNKRTFFAKRKYSRAPFFKKFRKGSCNICRSCGGERKLCRCN